MGTQEGHKARQRCGGIQGLWIRASTEGDAGPAYIEDADIVVDEIFHHLDLVLPFAIGLEEAGCEEQRQILGAHLVEVCTFLHPGMRSTGVRGWSCSG